MNKAFIRGSERIYGFLLKLYPQRFRQEFGEEMAYVFSESLRDICTGDGDQGIASLWGRTIVDAGKSLIIQHIENQKEGDAMNTKSIVRVAIATGLILLVPLIAMQITDEMNWGLFDFVFTGALLFVAGLAYEAISKKSGNTVYRSAFAIAIATAAFLFFSNLAVGIIGSEDELANVMYFGVIAVAIIGSVLARFRPSGMARAMFATALAQASTVAIALIFGMYRYPEGSVIEIFAVNGFFMMGWVVSGLLFRWAAESEYELDSKAVV
ncbi:MAG: hypothetical protein KA586_00355 [Candidatus Promineofilum sp.]|nr:hypothetical protein [Promineifilum sp.]